MVTNIINDAPMAIQCYKFRMPITPLVLTDEQLKSIRVPVLFLIGEHEVIYSPHTANDVVQKLKHVAPFIETEIIKGANHDITFVQAEMVNNSIIKFIKN